MWGLIKNNDWRVKDDKIQIIAKSYIEHLSVN